MEESTEAGGDAPRQSKLAEYLGALRPDTQVAVLRELELSELRGDALGPSFRVVMNELRRGIRKSGRKVERVGNPSRVFYMPVEPFLISEVPRASIAATVSRPSLNPLWAWICRDLMPGEAKTYIETTTQALMADDRPSAVVTAAVFQDKFIVAADSILARKNSGLTKRLAAYGGPDTMFDDLQSILYVIRNREALRDMAKRFPAKIGELNKVMVEQILALLVPLTETDDTTVLSHALAIVMSQLADPWQILRLAGTGENPRQTITTIFLGRAEAMAAGLRLASWSADRIDEARVKTNSLRAAIDLFRSELRPSEGGREDRCCKRILEKVDRFDRKIALAMSTMTGRPAAASDLADEPQAEQAAVA
jgi:hypothetical protein